MSTVSLKEQVLAEVEHAKARVYRAGSPTPLERITVPGIEADIFVKREDLSPINSYKWRGAYNCTAALSEARGVKTVVAASAGNHAQGVALAARMLGIEAKIFMPLTTPLMKQTAVKLHGGAHVEVILTGDTFDRASAEALAYTERNGYAYVHPFDDLHTIAGQATIACELQEDGASPFDLAFIQIGGGGLAAGIAAWMRAHQPKTRLFGVEGAGQASMKLSLAAGEPLTLAEIDGFCDGTAVKRPGDLTYALCKDMLEDILLVSNAEVCAAIQALWEARRAIPEPSGAMGLAGLIQFAHANPKAVRGKKLLSIVCGANMDFGTLSLISAQSAVGAHRRRYLRMHIEERKGSLLSLVETIFSDVNISEFQYGKTSDAHGWPIVAFEAAPERIERLFAELKARGIPYQDVTGDADVRYRIIPYNPVLFKRPAFMHVHFPERHGALSDFMRSISGVANVCYFNYAYSGESIGRALMGFEFDSDQDRERFKALIETSIVTCRPVPDEVAKRLLSGSHGAI